MTALCLLVGKRDTVNHKKRLTTVIQLLNTHSGISPPPLKHRILTMAKKRLQQATAAAAAAAECERMEEEEYSHVKQVLNCGFENKKLRLETETATGKVYLLEYEVVRLKEKARFEMEAAKDQVRLLSENQQKLEVENEKLQCFFNKKMVGRLDESLASNIAAPMVSPLSSKNKNSNPSASPAHQLSPDTDSVDAKQPPPLPPPPPPFSLPGWKKNFDHISGHDFYHNAASNVTQWHDPKTFSVTPPAPSDTTAPKNKKLAEEQAIMAIIEAHTTKPTMEQRQQMATKPMVFVNGGKKLCLQVPTLVHDVWTADHQTPWYSHFKNDFDFMVKIISIFHK